jgi:2-methylisocitrate lyase-like PEP mutase family enzyme
MFKKRLARDLFGGLRWPRVWQRRIGEQPVTTVSFRELLKREQPLVLPGAHDAISAKLIERAGFKGLFVGGFSSIGVRYGLPDIGLAGLGEISAAVRDIRAATQLPMMVDADDGYGDVKNVVNTVRTYERLGIASLFLEDQLAPKRCGHLAGKEIVPVEVMETKIRGAVAGRERAETFIIARTDARSVVGMDEALRRGERYLRAGADGIFIEAPLSLEELALVGRTFDAPNLVSMLEGGKTPIVKPSVLKEMGFSIVLFGITLLMRIVKTMISALDDLRSERLELIGTGIGLEEYFRIVGLDDWTRVERFGGDL